MQRGFLFKTLTILIISVFFLVSCGLPPPGTPLTPEQREEAKKKCILQYVGVGVVLGGITGALIGGERRGGVGAAIGALAGGALGYLVAYGKCIVYFSDLNTFPVAGYQETAKNEGYRSNQGNVVKIKNWSTTPSEVAPGNKLRLNGSYYVMAPQDLKEVKVKETRTLYFYDTTKMEWVELGPAENEVTTALGTRKADGTIDIPKELPEGKYRIDLKVSALDKEDVASTQYVVKKSMAMDNFLLFALNVDVNKGE